METTLHIFFLTFCRFLNLVEKNNFLFLQQEIIYLSSICYPSFWMKSCLFGIRVPGVQEPVPAVTVIQRGCWEFLFKWRVVPFGPLEENAPKTPHSHKDHVKHRHFLLKLRVSTHTHTTHTDTDYFAKWDWDWTEVYLCFIFFSLFYGRLLLPPDHQACPDTGLGKPEGVCNRRARRLSYYFHFTTLYYQWQTGGGQLWFLFMKQSVLFHTIWVVCNRNACLTAATATLVVSLGKFCTAAQMLV